MVIILKGVESFQDNNFVKSVSSHFVRAVFINQPEHCCELYLNNLSEFLKLSQVEDKKRMNDQDEFQRLYFSSLPLTLVLFFKEISSLNTAPKSANL